MYLDSRALFSIARHIKHFENLPRPRPHRLRHVPPRHTTVAWVTSLSNFYCSSRECSPFEPRRFSVRRCQTFTACVVRHLLVSTSRIIAAHLSVRGCVSIFAAFSTPCPGKIRVFLRPHSPPICRFALVNLSANRPFVRPLFFSTCLLHLDLTGSVSAFLLVQVFSLRRSGSSGTRWLVRGFLRGPLSHRSVKLLPYLLHCCRKFFFFLVGVPVRLIAG